MSSSPNSHRRDHGLTTGSSGRDRRARVISGVGQKEEDKDDGDDARTTGAAFF